MRLSLTAKLTLAFLGVVLTMAILVAFFVRRANVRQLSQLVSNREKQALKKDLEGYYRDNGTWDGVQLFIHPRPAGAPEREPRPNNRPPPPGSAPPSARQALFGAVDMDNVVVLAMPPAYRIGERVPNDVVQKGEALKVKDQQVGTLLPISVAPGLTPQESEFLRLTNNALLIGVLGAAIVGGFVAFLLTRTLTRPLRELMVVSQTLAKGEFGQQVSVRSQDEVGELATAFNQMSHDLAEANRLRRQMTADIAHDLRTPLTVLGGYLESMSEGLLKPTPERLQLMYSEVGNMERLVGDLRVLSRADSGELTLNLQELNPSDVVNRVVNSYQHRASQQDVSLNMDLAEDLPPVKLDEEQMARVLGNLVSNALRYTPANGRISFSTTAVSNGVEIQVADNGKGIEPEHLPYIFHRFYRADPSRQTESGESGLGLAIVQSIVNAHSGTVSAYSAGLDQGTTFTIQLPSATL